MLAAPDMLSDAMDNFADSSDDDDFDLAVEEDEAEKEEAPARKSSRSEELVLSAQPGSASELLGQQQFNGSFKLDAALARVVGKSLADLEGALDAQKLAPLSDHADVRAIWATAIALASFEKHHAASQDLWSMVAEKAKNYLIGLLKATGLDRKAARVKVDEFVQIATSAL